MSLINEEFDRKLNKFDFILVRACLEDVSGIVDTTNDAFMADAFFKKPEYHQRFTQDNVLNMISSENSMFLIAVQSSDSESSGNRNVYGSIYLHWTVKHDSDNKSIEFIGKFSAVSVPKKYERNGIGKALVFAVENEMIKIAKDYNKNNSDNSEISIVVKVEMGVVSARLDLIPWYESQGYRAVGDIIEDDPEIIMITKDGMIVNLILMRKVISDF
eukprot:gene7046-9621_t